MVENIPFMHRIAELVTSKQGMAEGAFATVLAAFALSSIVVGLVFFLLGKFKVGSAVYFFPRHVITGCIGQSRLDCIFPIVLKYSYNFLVPRWHWNFYHSNWIRSFLQSPMGMETVADGCFFHSRGVATMDGCIGIRDFFACSSSDVSCPPPPAVLLCCSPTLLLLDSVDDKGLAILTF